MKATLAQSEVVKASDIGIKRKSGGRGGLAKGVKANQPRSTQPRRHDPGGLPDLYSSDEDGDKSRGVLPTTEDLAQSFVDTEPPSEKAKLKAALARSQQLEEDNGLDYEDEGSEEGIGVGLSLPGFVAGFLKGVENRLRVDITGVQIDLTVNLDLASASPSAGYGAVPESLKLRLTVETISINEIPVGDGKGILSDQQSRDSEGISETGGERHISVKNIHGMLISDASLFTMLSQYSGPPSPAVTYPSTFSKGTNKTSHPLKSSSSSSSTGLATMQSTVFESVKGDPSHHKPLGSRVTSIGDRYFNAGSRKQSIDSMHFSDRADDPDGSQYKDFENTSHSFLDQVESEARIHDDEDEDSEGLTMSDFLEQEPQDEIEISPQSAVEIPLESKPKLSNEKDDMYTSSPETRPTLSNDDSIQPSDQDTFKRQTQRYSHSISRSSSSESSSQSHSFSDSPPKDLIQSKMFSHDEVESMYMSAVSNAGTTSQHDPVLDKRTTADGSADASSDEALDQLFHSFRGPTIDRSILEDSGRTKQSLSPAKLSTTVDFSSQSTPTSPRHSTLDRSGDHVVALTSDDVQVMGSPKVVSESEMGSERQRNSPSSSKSASCTVKHFLKVDSIDIKLPQAEIPSHQVNLEPNRTESRRETTVTPKLPGAFSVHESRTSSVSKHATPESIRWNLPDSREQPASLDTNEKSISVHIHDVILATDISFLRLAIAAMQQVPDIIQSSNLATDGSGKTSSLPPKASKGHKVEVNRFSLKFVDILRGCLEIDLQNSTPASIFPTSVLDVLLEIDAQGILMTQDNAGYSSRTELTIRRLTFGYPDDPIVSFNSAYKIRDSIRDIHGPVDQDVRLKISQISGSPHEISIDTLPLHISLDLARLDDTFAWFGGLSTVLGLGSSMISTVTVTEQKSRVPSTSKSPKGVRFATSKQNSVDIVDELSTQTKVNSRIGGFRFDLFGKESSLRIEGTAIRIVSRSALVGVGIDRLRFRGPILRSDSRASPIDAHIGPIRIEYTQVPKELDLERLLSLLSLLQNGTKQDPDILVDTLLRQRRNGGLLRINIEDIKGKISPLQDLERFQVLSEELKKLSTVAKYLPEDDRPGILILAKIQNLNLEVNTKGNLGCVIVDSKNIEIGLVTFPSLFLLSIDALGIEHHNEKLVVELVPQLIRRKERRDSGRSMLEQHIPMIRARLIGDEMEPTLKIKLHNFCIEYHVTTIMTILGVSETASGEIIAENVASSVATLTSLSGPPKLSSQSSSQSNKSSSSRPMVLDLAITDSAIALNPRGSPAKGVLVFTDAGLCGTFSPGKDADPSVSLKIKKSSLMIIDNKANLSTPRTSSAHSPSSIPGNLTQLQTLSQMGYVSVSDISSAKVEVKIMSLETGKAIDIEIEDDLFVLETCADSTQTLMTILNGLSPPVPPSKTNKYKTEETVPIEDMIKSCIEDALVDAQDNDIGIDPDFDLEDEELTGDMMDDDIPQNLEFISSFYNPDPGSTQASLENSMLEGSLASLASPPTTREMGGRRAPSSFEQRSEVSPQKAHLNFDNDHFETGVEVGGTAHRWNSVDNSYGRTQESKIRSSPFRLRVRDVHFIWNLFDGYDWQHTRDTISQVVSEVENRAAERLAAKRDKRRSLQNEDEDDSVEACLFNSVYVTIPANQDPRDLARQINRHLDDLSSEADSYATTTTLSASPSRQAFPKTKRRRLRLQRSKHHKMTFELKGVSADVIAFPPESGETQSSIDIRVHDLEIFDHVPTSTWKKFATYMRDAGERQSETNIIHIEVLNIKPVPELAASELSLKVTVLPLRLHVDQDALDFLTRFFEFKDETATKKPSASDEPFLSRVEINPISVKLDFKPKRVDYAGLRSGHTTEFMNFFILDGAEMVLRRTILYGVVGFEKLGKSLNDIWMPDIKSNQLPTVLAGLAPVRSLVNVGSGVRDLVVVPMREYRKDGRIVRAIQKGAFAFAKTTTTELAKLGAKLAIGTQNVLQNAEGLLVPADVTDADYAFPSGSGGGGGIDEDEIDDERRTISPYADQPINVVQGLRGAYRHLGRDLLLAKDAIVAMPGEVRESGSATGAARAVLRGAPTVVLRPALGVSKALGQTLLGAANSLDGGERRRVEDVSSLPFLLWCLTAFSLVLHDSKPLFTTPAPMTSFFFPLGFYHAPGNIPY